MLKDYANILKILTQKKSFVFFRFWKIVGHHTIFSHVDLRLAQFDKFLKYSYFFIFLLLLFLLFLLFWTIIQDQKLHTHARKHARMQVTLVQPPLTHN